jgi:transposase
VAEPGQRLRELEQEIERLRQDQGRLQEQLKQWRRKAERLEQENKRLEKELEAARRSVKRQAAPFSKGEPQADPKRPGRKAGAAYGHRACRPVPQRIDQQVAVPAPRRCLRCGGSVRVERVEPQYQEEIVRLTMVRRFDVEVGHCTHCGAHAQGRHPLQTSNALGAAKVQLGPEALALGAHLNKRVGLSLGQTTQVLQLGFGLQVSRAGISRALARMAEKAAPTYEQLLVTARQSLVNWMDETGWRVGGRPQWLWVAVSEEVTVYSILAGRGFAQAASILGADYDGWLLHDGLRLYYGFEKAYHQSCLAHLIRRCRDLLALCSPAAGQFARQVKGFLQYALELRDRHHSQEMTRHGLAVATGRLEARFDELLSRTFRVPHNVRLAKHLWHEQPYLFTFLHCPGLDATNNAAERALRPAVVARKVWGGNRTWCGARTQQILMSVLRTCSQQGKDAFALLVAMLRFPGQKILEVVPAVHPPPLPENPHRSRRAPAVKPQARRRGRSGRRPRLNPRRVVRAYPTAPP